MVSVEVRLQVEVDEGADPLALERAVAAEGRRVARELFREVVEVVDERAVRESGGARQRPEARWVATVFGRVRVWRYRVRRDGTSFHPLDDALGLAQSEPSAGLREAICGLALRLPYRQAAEVATLVTGDDVSHLSAWRVLQQEGTRVRAEDGALMESVFELGELPPDAPSPELVVVEADGTFLKAQREDQDRFEVKTGVFYTGKTPAGGRKHRRWRLVDKGCYATTADADEFGNGLAAQGFFKVGLHLAGHVLCAHDGLDEFGQTFRDWFPGAIHQVDHFHIAERIWWVTGGDAKRDGGCAGPGAAPTTCSPSKHAASAIGGRIDGGWSRLRAHRSIDWAVELIV
ncbi:MAG: UPF0236 family transposase-like protein [Actinomycetota bacterium]